MDITTSPATTAGRPADSPEATAMVLLSNGVPLSLLLDLGMPVGPRSHEILVEEGAPEEAWWEQP